MRGWARGRLGRWLDAARRVGDVAVGAAIGGEGWYGAGRSFANTIAEGDGDAQIAVEYA